MSTDNETYAQWLARMWRVANGQAELNADEQRVVAQHVLKNTGKTNPEELTLYMLRNTDEGLDLTSAVRNADGRHPQDLKAKDGRYMING